LGTGSHSKEMLVAVAPVIVRPWGGGSGQESSGSVEWVWASVKTVPKKKNIRKSRSIKSFMTKKFDYLFGDSIAGCWVVVKI